jgi:hypothetical protein
MGTLMTDNSNKTENIKPLHLTHPGQLRLILLSLVILIAGIVIGSAGTSLIIQKNAASLSRPVQGGAGIMTHKLKERLDLSDEQFAKIEPIINKHMKKLREIQESAHPLIVSEIDEMKESISLLLTEEQNLSWEKQLSSLERGFQHRGMRRGPGGKRGPRGGQRGPGGGPYGPDPGRKGGQKRPGGGPYGSGRGPGRGMGPRGPGAGGDRPFGPGPGFRGGFEPPIHDQNSSD